MRGPANLQALVTDYIADIRLRGPGPGDLVRLIGPRPTDEGALRLHRLAGSLGSMGFAEAGRLAGALDVLVMAGHRAPDDPRWRAQAMALAEALGNALGTLEPAASGLLGGPGGIGGGATPGIEPDRWLIVVNDPQPGLAACLAGMLAGVGFTAETAVGPPAAGQELAQRLGAHLVVGPSPEAPRHPHLDPRPPTLPGRLIEAVTRSLAPVGQAALGD
ncbi:hypothetical protein [Roseospirillum parvum]|uniref:Hpt domain-containing protein n=1 Tax=Roseospirillum parvum TaxID=83401 RepID=A0A1G7U930_9PROT|nr:hypothetical protein [Roseospirillum parvum]SDG43898.1 hypothetical protein SAMN05421742_101249 [Roseospirillum parvum]